MAVLTQNWQRAIIAEYQEKLSRILIEREIALIAARLCYLGPGMFGGLRSERRARYTATRSPVPAVL
jgi:hypothetical protein